MPESSCCQEDGEACGPFMDQEREIDRLKAVLKSAHAALVECANIIRPMLPSFSDNVIGAHLNEINSVIGNPDRSQLE